MREDAEQSGSGAPIFRHSEPEDPVPGEQAREAERIEAHVEQHLGPIEHVYHELVSEYVHLDVLMVPAHDERPFHTLVTCGMSARPMAVPDGNGAPRYAELLIGLPPEWPLDEASWRDERHYWPVRLLKQLARLPHEYGTWLGAGHTIPNGDPPEPYAPGTRLCCGLVARALTTSDEFDVLELDDGPLAFYGVIALHRDEMELKLSSGMEALADPFERARVSEVVDPRRPSALARRKRFGLF